MNFKYVLSTLCLLAISVHTTMPGMRQTAAPTPYQTLKVAPNASQKQIDNAYKTLYAGARDARERFLLSKAYDAIKDPRKRREYDQKVADDAQKQQATSYIIEKYLEAQKRQDPQQRAVARAEILLQRLENEPLTQELEDEFNNLMQTFNELNIKNEELMQKLQNMFARL